MFRIKLNYDNYYKLRHKALIDLILSIKNIDKFNEAILDSVPLPKLTLFKENAYYNY